MTYNNNNVKTIGIICEYNPFHSGHLYQIQQIKKAYPQSTIVALMSGEFVQRGGCSILDKHTRAKLAVINGVDLCLQLPIFFSTQVAEIFAKGAVSTFKQMKLVDALHFGSEIADVSQLVNLSEQMLSFKKSISNLKKDYSDSYEMQFIDKNSINERKEIISNLNSGKSYIRSLSEINGALPKSSNNILAVEYISAIKELKANIQPITIKRQGNPHDSLITSGAHLSATAIRKLLQKNDLSSGRLHSLMEFLPLYEKSVISPDNLRFDDDFLDMIKYSILSNVDDLPHVFEVKEGIENRIINCVNKTKTYEEFLFQIKSKRYTLSRIRRILFNILLQINKNDIITIQNNNYKAPYLRVLAFNDRGRQLLRHLKNHSDMDIITKVANYNPADEYKQMFFEKDIFANQVYNIPKKSKSKLDYQMSPVYIR